eukprot:Opistho-2@93819
MIRALVRGAAVHPRHLPDILARHRVRTLSSLSPDIRKARHSVSTNLFVSSNGHVLPLKSLPTCITPHTSVSSSGHVMRYSVGGQNSDIPGKNPGCPSPDDAHSPRPKATASASAASTPDEENSPLEKVPEPSEIAERFPWHAGRRFSTAYPDDGGIVDSIRLGIANLIGRRTFGLTVTDPTYWDSDFRDGALQAFKSVTDLISRRDVEELVPLLGPEVLRRFRDSFLWMAKRGITLTLKVNPDSVTLPRLRRLRVIVGNPAVMRPGSMHVDDFFGHKLYIDASWMRNQNDERVPTNALSFRAVRSGVRLQVDTAIECTELFNLRVGDQILLGSDEEQTALHRFTFEAFVSEDHGITDLEWRVADIDRAVNVIER